MNTDLPLDLCALVLEYVDDFCVYNLSREAFKILNDGKNYYNNTSILCKNKSHATCRFLKGNKMYINWESVCENPTTISLVEQEYYRDRNSKNLNWFNISKNPNAINIIGEELMYRIYERGCHLNFYTLCLNENLIYVIDYVKKADIISVAIVQNSSCLDLAIEYLEDVPLLFSAFCKNKNPLIIDYIIKNYEIYEGRIDFYTISSNPNFQKLIDFLNNKGITIPNYSINTLTEDIHPLLDENIFILDNQTTRKNIYRFLKQ